MPKIRCPYCKKMNTELWDSRERDRGHIRYRLCNDCGKKFTTVECYSERCVEDDSMTFENAKGELLLMLKKKSFKLTSYEELAVRRAIDLFFAVDKICDDFYARRSEVMPLDVVVDYINQGVGRDVDKEVKDE